MFNKKDILLTIWRKILYICEHGNMSEARRHIHDQPSNRKISVASEISI